MNPYGKIFRCKSSFHPQSEEPTSYKRTTPVERKRPTLLRLDSTGEISSDDHRSTMTGENGQRKFSSNCNRMGTLMNSTLFSWSKLSSQKQLISGTNSANNIEIINNLAKNMNSVSTESVSHPTKHTTGETSCNSVLPQQTYPYHCANTFRNKMKGALGMNSTMNGQFSPMLNRNYPKNDFSRNADNRLPYTNRGNNTYRHWKKECHRNSHWQHPHRHGEHLKNKEEEMLGEKKMGSSNTCVQISEAKDKMSTSEVKLNSINMLKNILLQNELLNSTKSKVCDNKSQENISSQLPLSIEKSKETSEPVCDETNEDAKQDCEKANIEITDWFSMGRSDSVDLTSNEYSSKFKTISDFGNNGAILEKLQCEKLDKDCNSEDSCVMDIDKSDLYNSGDVKQADNIETSNEQRLEQDKMNNVCNEKKENSNSDNKDYSFVLFVRNNNKKCRPSVQKRRRSKARMSDCENSKEQRTRHVSVNIQNAKDGHEKEADNSECNSKASSSNAVAFILGFDPSVVSDNESTRSHSFVVSFSDSEDTDSDFGSDDDGESFSDENFEDFQFASPLNLNVICSVNKPEKPENSKLKALNMAWKINIQVKDCKPKPNRKVHFADENKLEEVHPIIAWSYAYQAARKGPWEEYARDRERFRNRIMAAEKIINPVLQRTHRQKIYSKYFNEN